MLMNTTFLGDSFSIKWQSRVAIWVCVCGHILGGVGEIWLLFLCVKITDKYRTGHAYYGINI